MDHERKIRNRRQRTDIGNYSSVNRTIRLWNRLPAEILGTLPRKPNAFRKRIRKVINAVNWRNCDCAENKLKVKWSEVKGSAVKGGGVKSGRAVKGIYWWWSKVKVMLKLVYITRGLTIFETRSVLSSTCVAFLMCIAANCSWSVMYKYCVIILCVFLLPHV